MKKSTRTNKLTTNLLYILDESGSMQDIKSAVIDGFNEYMNGLKTKGGFKVTLTKFDSEGLRTPYSSLEIKKVPKLNADTYRPNASTPLYDSVVNSVENLAKEVKDNQPVLVAIQTDGLENASHEHTEKCLRELIQKLTAKGNYTFVFLGANQDSWATAQTWGIPQGNIANWQATPTGTMQSFNLMRGSSMAYSATMLDNSQKGVALNTSNFFSKTGEGIK